MLPKRWTESPNDSVHHLSKTFGQNDQVLFVYSRSRIRQNHSTHLSEVKQIGQNQLNQIVGQNCQTSCPSFDDPLHYRLKRWTESPYDPIFTQKVGQNHSLKRWTEPPS